MECLETDRKQTYKETRKLISNLISNDMQIITLHLLNV